jgi:hypothetical protein
MCKGREKKMVAAGLGIRAKLSSRVVVIVGRRGRRRRRMKECEVIYNPMCILFCPDLLLAADLVAVPSCCEFRALIIPQREWKALNTCKGMEGSGYYGYT